jgi:uncharacterized protein (DUF4415 family)
MRDEYDFSQSKASPFANAAKGKTRITIRLDEDIVAWFKQQVDEAGGGNYQTLINSALRQFMSESKEPFEAVLRRVLKEELRNAS